MLTRFVFKEFVIKFWACKVLVVMALVYREDVVIDDAFSEEALIEPPISCWVNICDVLMEFVDSAPICALLKTALFATIRPVLKELA